MELEKILENITAGLTGDAQTDIVFLKKQIEVYHDHVYAQEIVRACGRMLYSLLPGKEKAEFQSVMEREQMGMESALEEIRFLIFRKEYKKAEKMLFAMVEHFESNGRFRDDQMTEYHSFYEPFEEVLYRFVDRPDKRIYNLEMPYAQLYHEYGCLLLEMGKYDQAHIMLHKAHAWNPANAQILSDYADACRKQGDLEMYFTLVREAFHYAFRKEDVARCYRNLGYYFVQNKEYSAAAGCYLLSMDFDREDQEAPAELYYIQAVTKEGRQQPSQEEMEQYSRQYGFPMGADPVVVGLAWESANRYLDSEKYDAAVYYLRIVYDLTGEAEAKRKLDAIPIH